MLAINAQRDVIQWVFQPFKNPQAARINAIDHWQVVEKTFATLIQKIPHYQIEAIAIDATSGSVMLADRSGQAMTDLLLYHATEGLEATKLIALHAPNNSAAQGIGSGLSKLLYLQTTKSDYLSYLLLHQADWIASQLGAEVGITDYNNALKSGYDLYQNHWPDWVSDLAHTACLPKVVAPGTVIGQLSKSCMQAIGLQQAYPPQIKAGTTDSIAAVIATGSDVMGDAITSLGSTLVLKQLCRYPVFDAKRGLYSHKLGDYWLAGGASNSGGNVLRHFFSDSELESLSAEIDLTTSPPEYYPLLTCGERFPVYDPTKMGHLTPRPSSDSLFLHGLLDGIAAIEKAGYDALQSLTKTPLGQVKTVGGGAQNTVWQQLRQQKLSVPITVAAHSEAAYGAACLAYEGLTRFITEAAPSHE